DLRTVGEDASVVVVDPSESLADTLGAPTGDGHTEGVADRHAQQGTEKPLLIRAFARHIRVHLDRCNRAASVDALDIVGLVPASVPRSATCRGWATAID